MKFSLSSGFVRQSLAGHSWIGLMASALMYLVCLTGVPVVFMHELGRWEQPEFEAPQAFEPAMLKTAYKNLISHNPDAEGAITINLPAQDLPRLMIRDTSQTWLVNNDGSLLSAISHPFIDQLIALHVHLHMPRTIGVIIVGILGVLLCALIVSGVAAHPRIFKDAFSFRIGGADRIEQVDIHNRLSVWNLPFQFIIAISGAFFGVYNFALLAVAFTHNDGNTREIMSTIYGQDIVVEESIITPDFTTTLNSLNTIAPESLPFQITVENANTEKQYLLVTAKHPERLIYGEEYYFSADGTYLQKHGFSDGPTGRQVLFSIHSLHLGDYGGMAIKILYGVLGIAMTIVCATGFNIWLKRRHTLDWLNNAWTGFVWGVPLAILFSALAQVLLGLSGALAFWGTLVLSLSYSQWRDNPPRSKVFLMTVFSAASVIIVAFYCLKFGSSAFNPLSITINILIITSAIIIAILSRKVVPSPS